MRRVDVFILRALLLLLQFHLNIDKRDFGNRTERWINDVNSFLDESVK